MSVDELMSGMKGTSETLAPGVCCPKCGEAIDSVTQLPNPDMVMYNHRLPKDEWMIPGIPQSTGCIVPKKMKL